MTKLFEVANSATSELAASSQFYPFAMNATKFLDQLKQIQPTISTRPEEAHILAYVGLRVSKSLTSSILRFRLKTGP
jgi:hypothetical protein